MANDYTGLLSGSNWGGIEVSAKPTIVTFSFPITAPAYNASITDVNLTPAALASFQAFSPAEQTLARQALAEWGDNSGLIFIEVSPGQGDINFQKLNFTGTGYAGSGGIAYHAFGNWQFSSYPYFTSDLDAAGDVFMNSTVPVVYGTLLHEIGHSLGLKHPTEVWTDYAANPPVVHNVWSVNDPNLTIMAEGPGGNGHLKPVDIQAIQSIYGTQAQDGSQVASWSWDAANQRLTQSGFATDDAIRGSSVADSINGNNGNDKLFGLNANDTLSGGSGNDLIDGGPGNDSLYGGAGDDMFFVDAASDKVFENANEGYDSVIATISYTLPVNVELLQFWGTVKATGKGNDLANTIYGNDAGDKLSGLGGNDYIVSGIGADNIDGGTGVDSMYGGLGNDTYAVDNGSDVIGEAASAGTDLVNASVTHILGDNLENLTLTGTAAIDGTGNALANSIKGNAAANHLFGGDGADKINGGAGADTMTGGNGSDSYTVDNLGDRVVETGTDGTDIVSSSVTFTLATAVEKLTLTGTLAIDGTGNSAANTLTGNGAANALFGLDGKDTLSGGSGDDRLSGGALSDQLTGGTGNDTFIFDTAPVSGSLDTIKDFKTAQDHIALAKAAFSAFAAEPLGTLASSQFIVGTAATSSTQHLIYNGSTGALYYDDDGSGSHAQIQIALLSGHPLISASDILLI